MRLPIKRLESRQNAFSLPDEVFPEEEGIELSDLREYVRVVANYKWSIIGLTVMVAILTTLVVFNMQPIYRSTATVLVESNSGKVVSIQDPYVADTNQKEYFQTQFELLKSRKLAREVVVGLKLADHPLFQPNEPLFNWRSWLPFDLPEWQARHKPNPDADPLDPIIKAVMDDLKITPRRNTQLADVSFESEDPKLASEVVNALAEAYIEENMEARVASTKKAAAWLADRRVGLRAALTESEKRLQDYLEHEHLVDLQGVMTLSGKEIEGITGKLVDASNARMEAESVYNKVRNLSNDAQLDIDAVPDLYQDSVIQNLKQKEAEASQQVSELRDRYGPEFPAFVAAQSELDNIRRLIRQHTNSIIAAIKHRYDVARNNEAALVAALEHNKEIIQGITRKQAKLQELQSDVDANRNLYDMFIARYKETSEVENLRAANARVVDPGVVPSLPAKPKKGLIIGLSFFASLLLSVALAFLRERLDNSLRTPEDVENKLAIPFLGAIPLLKEVAGEPFSASTVYKADARGGYAEAIRTIRTGIMLSAMDTPRKVILVTSTIPGEGKSTFAYNLAVSLAGMESVLLIDADLRRPTVGKICNIADKHLGLADHLAYQTPIQKCIVDDAAEFAVIPAGRIPPNPLDLLATKAFADFIESVQERFDTLIIDSPPMHLVSDTHLLAQLVDQIAYVVEADRTPVQTVRASIKRLKRLNLPVAGAVVNKLDQEKKGGYEGYHYGYGSYGYGHAPDDAGSAKLEAS